MKHLFPAFILLFTLLTQFACRNVDYYIERERDPDTVDAIRKFNEPHLEGAWLIENGDRRIYLEFEGETYRAVFWKGEEVLVSDQGSIEHNLPGEILLKSGNMSCTAKEFDRIFLRFDRKGRDPNQLKLLRVDNSDRFDLTRSEPLDLPLPSTCLWDLK